MQLAADQLGLDLTDASIIAIGENEIWRVRPGLVARVARPGQDAVSAKELRVAGWLAARGIPAVRPAAVAGRPVLADGRSTTFWEELPPHGPGRPNQLGDVLRALHRQPVPTFLAPLEPFVRLPQRLDASSWLPARHRSWLERRLGDLTADWGALPAGLPDAVVHGDAHESNIVSAEDGRVVILDLERFAVGPPEWDLMLMAAHFGTAGWRSRDDYDSFVVAYGSDVMLAPRFPLVRAVRELRLALYAGQLASENPAFRGQAQHRVECLMGMQGPRPWPTWLPIP